jgi:hypothetical protein
VKTSSYLFVLLFFCIHKSSTAQEFDRSATISLFTGAINYQGDLNPNSFTFRHSNLATGLLIRKPMNRWFTVRAGLNMGKISASDSWNREYLKERNLSFTTSIKEAYIGLELTVLDLSTTKFTPFLYGGASVFHFNPWARDNSGAKVFLKPLSTEGQGLAPYPDQKPYNLTQFALSFGGGMKYAITDGFALGIEFHQRKSFTDYIDDVSSHYVDGDVLRQAKGLKAVEMAYRGDEIPGGRTLLPAHGDQRGTPSEMDWFYFYGVTLEMKLNSIGGLFSGNKTVASQRCPRF